MNGKIYVNRLIARRALRASISPEMRMVSSVLWFFIESLRRHLRTVISASILLISVWADAAASGLTKGADTGVLSAILADACLPDLEKRTSKLSKKFVCLYINQRKNGMKMNVNTAPIINYTLFRLYLMTPWNTTTYGEVHG